MVFSRGCLLPGTWLMPVNQKTQLFLVIDNKVILELSSCIDGLSSLITCHHVLHLEYPMETVLCLQFLEKNIFDMIQSRKTQQYRIGVVKVMS